MLSTGIIDGDGSSGLAFSTPFYTEDELAVRVRVLLFVYIHTFLMNARR